jgi:Carboxypeptidase regulatory-like domain
MKSILSSKITLGLASALLFFCSLCIAQIDPAFQIPNVLPYSQTSSLSHNNDRQTSSAQSSSEHGASQAQLRLGTIMGTILDQSGAVAVGAKLKLTGENGAEIQEVVSGDNGQFSFSRVSAGHFQLSVSAPGFAPQIFSGELSPGQTFLVPAIKLPIERAETEVRVAEPAVEVAQIQIKQEEKQRALGFIPNFYVSYVPDAAPLNARQKFELAWKTAVDPITFVGAGVYAGLEQAGDRYPEYGQGLEGYAKRYGQGYASTVSGIFIGNAILPSVFKQDPRYFYKGSGTTRSRFIYAVSSSVICKGDNKRWQPNYSFILGSIATGGVSDALLPAKARGGPGLVFQNALIRIGQGSLGGILQEFVVRHLTPHANRAIDQP